MATAAVKVIDVSRSYVPIDPESFPESMHATGAEDAPEARVPVVPYNGYNFMPTGYGYMSYFGINSLFGVALTETASPFDPLNCDDLFIVQTPTLSNILVALCEDGIYTKKGNNEDAWEQVIALTAPDAGEHKNWTRCVIGNEVFLYRAGEAHFWVMRTAENFVPTEQTPTHITMSAQQGIFKAGGRLGFWDSANSTTWSDPDDKTDYVPSLETGVAAVVFQQIIGKIVNVIGHGNGFIIYATKSIVHVQRTTDAFMFFSAREVFNDNGISYLNQAIAGQPDTIHFAFTTFGIIRIENGNPEYIVPEVFSYLRESRDPVFLKLLEGRYLFFQILNAKYVTGIPNFSVEEVAGSELTWKGASYALENITLNPCKTLRALNSPVGPYMYNNYGYTGKSQATTEAEVPVWHDFLDSLIDFSKLKAWMATGVADHSSYFDNKFTAEGAITKLDGSGYEYFIPTGMCLVSVYAFQHDLQEFQNANSFFTRQDLLFISESAFQEDWMRKLITKAHNTVYNGAPDSIAATVGQLALLNAVPSTKTLHTFGPYIDVSFFSEFNKYYGLVDKSAWLQRSLTRRIYIDVIEALYYGYVTQGNLQFSLSSYTINGGLLPATYASYTALMAGILADVAADNAAWKATYDAANSPNYVTFSNPQVEETVGRTITHTVQRTFSVSGSSDYPEVVYTSDLVDNEADNIGQNLLEVTRTPKQAFPFTPKIRYDNVNACVYKELGYTRIMSHGHYDENGDFIDDEAQDRTEANALTELLTQLGQANEAAMWAAVGQSTKAGFLAFFGYASYVAIADVVAAGWSNGVAEAADYVDQCDISTDKDKKVSINGTIIPDTLSYGCIPGPDTIDSQEFTYPDQTIQLPPSSFLMQDGSIEPIYPTFEGAFVYDLHYKKWGKMWQPHKVLLNFSPINSQAGDKPVPADIFNVNAGCLLSTGDIAIFDKYPANSKIVYGKVGYFRKGFTDCHEVDVQFRNAATGSIQLEGSIDGKNINPAISLISSFTNVNKHTAYFSSSARWFNLIIEGIYDIKNIDFNGSKKGKR